MYFAYFDESGDAGFVRSPGPAFTLSAVLVNDREWMDMLDELVAFRRFLKANYGINPSVELKANWLVNRKGPFRHLPLTFETRMSAYRAALRFQRKCNKVRTFAVVINKQKIGRQWDDAPRAWAWTFALQRLERFGTEEGENVHVLPDEGHGQFIRKKIREMRRYNNVAKAFGTGYFNRQAKNLLEDSSDRRSHESYFVQMADLNAYAAFRCVYPGRVIDGSLWNELGDSRVGEVNKIRGGPRGIVSWP